jgi:AraC-like DNA-binding protein
MWLRMDTGKMPAGERDEWFRDAVARAVVPVRIAVEDASAFRARAELLPLDRLTLSRFSFTALRSWRPASLIRRSDPGHYCLALITSGTMTLSQRRSDAVVSAGEAVLFSTSQPWRATTGITAGGARLLLFNLPRDTVALPHDKVDGLIATGLGAREGMGALLGRFARSLADHADECSAPELRGLEATAVDLATAFLARRLDTWDRLPAPARDRVLLARIDAFIDRNLVDPELSPRTVAARHQISLRALYALFEQRGEGVAASIRRRRLELCRADLTDPTLRSRPLHAIAARRGFNSADAFARAFRARYGTGPHAFRRQAGTGPGAEPGPAPRPKVR